MKSAPNRGEFCNLRACASACNPCCTFSSAFAAPALASIAAALAPCHSTKSITSLCRLSHESPSTLGSSSSIGGAGNQTVIGDIAGNFALTKSGSGTITLTGTNTYTPSSLLTVNNFFEGNKLVFSSNIGSNVNNTNYFKFSGGFTPNWNGSAFTITAIPEPPAHAAAAGIIGLVLWPSRRRLFKDAKSILGLRPSARDRMTKRA